ncbi:fatty acid desaturase [Oceaniserpentilla sp. 4NH20-0058]|uniref:fatty acid desaturase family protein n=1 Tax=Oceaniserpentilla sp. 4NH20-0058 TaxID=3127660 RepID=UPI00310C4FB2
MNATERLKAEKSALIKKYANRNNGFALYQTLSTIIPYFALFYLAIELQSVSYWLSGLCIFLLIMFIMRVFMMMHDAGHGCLFVTPRQNSIVGFIMGVLCGVPEYVWSKHHAYHHATNGNWSKYRGPLAVLSSEEFSKLSEKKQKSYQNSRNILLAPLAGFMYFIFTPRFTWIKGTIQFVIYAVKHLLVSPKQSWKQSAELFETNYWADWKEYRHMAANNIVLISLIVAGCVYFGFVPFMTVYLIALSVSGGLGIILFTIQHNFEDSYAVGDDVWDYNTAAIEGTSYFDLPRILHWFTADIGYHHVHHLSARIPNYKLRECHEEYVDLFKDVPTIRLKDVFKSFQYILWDEASGRMITVEQFHQQYAQPTPSET